MKKLMCVGVVVGAMLIGSVAEASKIEYYKDNLFLGLAYHRVGCLTDGNKILSNQDYDGFTTKRYCYKRCHRGIGARREEVLFAVRH